MRRNAVLDQLESRAGIVFPGALDFLPHFVGKDGEFTAINMDAAMALDAEPGLITSPNAGIPSFLTQYVDPRVINVILSPLASVQVYGEEKIGTWVDETATFPMFEMTGETSSYGDFATSGRSGGNAQYVNRQAYRFQTFTEWGELELERMGRGMIDYAARLNISSANTLNRFANDVNFYGISNLLLYGGLNDPSLSAALTPATKTAGGTGWKLALPTEILADVQAMFAQLQTQTTGNLKRDAQLKMIISPVSEIYIANTNSFGLTAAEMIKKAFPNLTIEVAVQLQSGSVYSAQLIADNVPGVGAETIRCAFGEKLRAHRVVADTSSWRQKKSAHTWGAIIKYPAGIAQMAGI